MHAILLKNQKDDIFTVQRTRLVFVLIFISYYIFILKTHKNRFNYTFRTLIICMYIVQCTNKYINCTVEAVDLFKICTDFTLRCGIVRQLHL